VTGVPDHLVLKRHRDLEGRERNPWTRRVLLTLLAVVLGLGALNVFGQRPATARADGAAGSLEVYAPTRLRGGVFWMARFHVRARREIRRATLVLDPGWLEQMHLNTLEPAPIGEASRDGRIALDFGRVPSGQSPIGHNLRRERITLEEIAAAARQQGIASLAEVQWAVLETGGRISFIRKTS
jgi:hypothetical protein